MAKDYELEQYIKDYIEYCNRYRDSDRHYPKGRKPKVESFFRALDEFHPEERAHHHEERKYWKYNFRTGAVVSVGSIITVILSLVAVILSKLSLDDAHSAMQAAQTQAKYAKISYEAGSQATIATFGVEWLEPPQKDHEGFIQILYGNIGKNKTIVKVIPEYRYANIVSRFGFGTVDAGPNTNCLRTDKIQKTGVPALPMTGSGYKTPMVLPKEAINTMLSGEYSLVVRGCYVYEDFGRTFYAPFCYVAGQGNSTASSVMSPICAGYDEDQQTKQ